MGRRLALAVTLGLASAGTALGVTLGKSAVWLAAGVALVLIVAMASPLALAVPFVLVQLLGENFRLPLLPIATVQASYAVVALGVLWRGARSRPRLDGAVDRSVAALALTLVPAVLLGWAGGAGVASIKEDLAPLVFLLATYLATRVLVRTTADLDLVLAAILTGTLLAAAKVGYLAITPVEIGWDSAWQAIRLNDYGWHRLILRGADVCFAAVTVFLVAQVLVKERARPAFVLAGLASGAGLVAAGTRSNLIGVAAGLGVVVLAASSVPRVRWRVACGTTLAAVAVLVVLVASERAQQTAMTLVRASEARAWTIDFRQFEDAGVLATVADSGALGNGLGSTFEYWDVEQQRVSRTGWSHNGYLQLMMKTGLLGLFVFLFALYRAGHALMVRIRSADPMRDRWLGLLGATTAILVLSIGANKIFQLSGAMCLGFALAVAQAAGRLADVPDSPVQVT